MIVDITSIDQDLGADFFRALFMESADAMFVADGGSRLLLVNPAASQLLGDPADLLVGASLLEMIDDPARRRDLLHRLDEAGVVRDVEITLTLRDGAERDMLVSAVRMRGDGGERAGRFFGSLRDVTLQSRTRELLGSLARFPAEDPDPLLRVSRAGTIRYLNVAGEPLLEHWGVQIGGRLPRPWLEHVKAALREGRPRRVELEEAGRTWLLLCVPVPKEDYVNLYTADVSELRRAERLLGEQAGQLESANDQLKAANERLAGQADRLEMILRGIGDGVIVTDLEHRVMMINEVARRMLDVSTGRGTGNIIFSLLGRCAPPADQVRRDIEQCDPDQPVSIVMELIQPDPRALRMVVSAWRDRAGAPAGRILILRDVTREREIDRLKTAFIGSVSHELRTPLTSIRGFTRALREEPAMDEATRLQFLRILDQETERLGALIEDLLEIARLEEGDPIRLEPVELDRLIRAACCSMGPAVEAAGLKLELMLEEGLPRTPGDPEALQRVLINLLGNAVKFTPAGGRIEIGARSDGGRIVLSVGDSGIGIPAHEQERIFERFYRVNRPGVETAGTGLGLAIAREIAERHGGRIEVSSEPGRGSVFSVYLPLGDVIPAAGDPRHPAAPSQTGIHFDDDTKRS